MYPTCDMIKGKNERKSSYPHLLIGQSVYHLTGLSETISPSDLPCSEVKGKFRTWGNEATNHHLFRFTLIHTCRDISTLTPPPPSSLVVPSDWLWIRSGN